jgi:hypothetical protein
MATLSRRRNLVKKTIMFMCVLTATWLAMGASADAAEPFDPAARARVIAPFIEEETVAIVHMDSARVDVDSCYEQIGRLVPGAQADLADERKRTAEELRVFTAAGARDVYFVLRLAGNIARVEPDDVLVTVVPLPPGADVDALIALIKRACVPPINGFERVGDVLLAGTRESIDRLKANKPDVRPELEKAFEAAGDTAAQLLVLPPKHTARTLNEMMPELPKQVGGGPISVLTKGCLWAALGVDLPPKMAVRVVIQSADEDAAIALVAKYESVTGLLKNEPDVAKHVPNFEKVCEALKPRVEGDQVVLVLDEQNQGVARLAALLAPPIEAARASAKRMQSMNNMKQIALAMLNYESARKAFPPAASYDKDSKPLLSWRVHILPYLEENKLYQQFHLDEPWDSPNNKRLIDRMPACLRSPASKLADRGRTNYVVVTGPGTVFDGKKGTSIRDIRDGTSMTIMVVEADDTHAPIWTKPEDLPFDPKEPKRGLGGLWNGKTFLTAFCDGSVRALATDIRPEILRHLILKDEKVVNQMMAK